MKRISAESIAYDYIRKARKPVPVKEVIDYVIDRYHFVGKTPRNSVSSVLQRSRRILRKNGDYTAL